MIAPPRLQQLYGLGEHRIRARRGPALLLGYAVAGEATVPAAIRELAAAVDAADAANA